MTLCLSGRLVAAVAVVKRHDMISGKRAVRNAVCNDEMRFSHPSQFQPRTHDTTLHPDESRNGACVAAGGAHRHRTHALGKVEKLSLSWRDSSRMQRPARRPDGSQKT
jgi:hypothetical protein